MLIYDKYFSPVTVDLPITLFGSGSKGNSCFIEPARLLIDLGLTRDIYQNHFKQVDRIALTHIHGDHLNLATLKHVLRTYPHIQFILPPTLLEKVDPLWEELEKRTTLLTPKKSFYYDTREHIRVFITPYRTKHGDLKNVAYDVNLPYFNTRLMYATDLEEINANIFEETDGLPDELYNLILLEANYDQDKLHQILEGYYEEERQYGSNKALTNLIFRAKSNFRHLSEQEAGSYVAKHLTPGGLFIPLHASETFGTYIQHYRAKAEAKDFSEKGGISK